MNAHYAPGIAGNLDAIARQHSCQPVKLRLPPHVHKTSTRVHLLPNDGSVLTSSKPSRRRTRLFDLNNHNPDRKAIAHLV